MFLSVVLGTLGDSLLGNLLTDKVIIRSTISGREAHILGQWVIRAGEGTIRADQDF